MSREENQEKHRDRKKMLALRRAKFSWMPGDIQIISGPKKDEDTTADPDEEQKGVEGRGHR